MAQKKRRKDKFLPISDPKYLRVLRKVSAYTSKFISEEVVEKNISSFNVCFDRGVELILVEPHTISIRVYMKPLPNGKTYVYKFFLKELDILFSLLSFKCKMLTTINMVSN